MFTKQSIFSLVDILFKDMDEDHKIFDPDELSSEEDDESKKESSKYSYKRQQVFDERFEGVNLNDIEDEDDPNEYGKDMNEYLEVKGVLSIERIKDIVGEIVGSC